MLVKRTRPAFSQFGSLEIRRSASFMKFRNVVSQILKLYSCERVGREAISVNANGDSQLKLWNRITTSVFLEIWSGLA